MSDNLAVKMSGAASTTALNTQDNDVQDGRSKEEITKVPIALDNHRNSAEVAVMPQGIELEKAAPVNATDVWQDGVEDWPPTPSMDTACVSMSVLEGVWGTVEEDAAWRDL